LKCKTLKDYDFKDKYVFLRSDLNSEINEKTKKIVMNERIIESSKTIKYLIKKKAKVVVISHQGNKGKNDFISLKQHAKLLNKFVKIKFVKDICGNLALHKIKDLKPGEALLLENIRFLDEEINLNLPFNKITNILAPLFDCYVNDAFSVCHRNHSSITKVPQIIKHKFTGLLLEKELNALKKISIKNALYLLGGAKPEENIKLLNGRKIKVLAGGLFSQLCLVAKGKDLGFQNDFLKKTVLINQDYDNFLSILKSKQSNVITPLDFAVNYHGKRKEFLLNEFPLEYEIEDIGKNTVQLYKDEIKKAKVIFMKGPFGNTGIKKFSKSTVQILKAISNSNVFSLIGGGHLSQAIKKSKIPFKRFSHISLSGGALIDYIAKEKLPGLKALA
jgi:phosphoglycerate kinase